MKGRSLTNDFLPPELRDGVWSRSAPIIMNDNRRLIEPIGYIEQLVSSVANFLGVVEGRQRIPSNQYKPNNIIDLDHD